MNVLERLSRFLIARADAPAADVPQSDATGATQEPNRKRRPKHWQLHNQAIYQVKNSVSSLA